jgi:hypothetical protein
VFSLMAVGFSLMAVDVIYHSVASHIASPEDFLLHF